jgi:hypothetical protein
MKIYDSIFFWLGGVLTDTLAERTAAELIPGVKGHDGIHLRQQLRALADELALGTLTPADYCQQAVAICQSAMIAADLERRILATPIRPPMADLVSKLPSAYERWLVVDYPPAWYEKLAADWQIPSLFPYGRVISIPDLGLVNVTPDIFYRLPQAVGRRMDECIVVDGLSARTVAAMKHGLAAVFYVYPERLKLELALQNIWQTNADVMHPTSSERVNFA